MRPASRTRHRASAMNQTQRKTPSFELTIPGQKPNNG